MIFKMAAALSLPDECAIYIISFFQERPSYLETISLTDRNSWTSLAKKPSPSKSRILH